MSQKTLPIRFFLEPVTQTFFAKIFVKREWLLQRWPTGVISWRGQLAAYIHRGLKDALHHTGSCQHRFLKPSLHNEAGFSLVSLLAFLPAALSLLAFSSVTVLALATYSKSHMTCRKRLLTTQKQLIKPLEQLLQLNPRARRLRRQKRAAQKALKAALAAAQPHAIAAARTTLKFIRGRQIYLKRQQQTILSQARQIVRTGKKKLHRKLRRQNSTHVHVTQAGSPGVAVFPRPVHSLSPSYRLRRPFSRWQALKGRWRVALSSKIPEWLKDFFPVKGVLKGRCATTIQKRRQQWIPRLSAAKFL